MISTVFSNIQTVNIQTVNIVKTLPTECYFHYVLE